jgi:hypothetical protein
MPPVKRHERRKPLTKRERAAMITAAQMALAGEWPAEWDDEEFDQDDLESACLKLAD